MSHRVTPAWVLFLLAGCVAGGAPDDGRGFIRRNGNAVTWRNGGNTAARVKGPVN